MFMKSPECSSSPENPAIRWEGASGMISVDAGTRLALRAGTSVTCEADGNRLCVRNSDPSATEPEFRTFTPFGEAMTSRSSFVFDQDGLRLTVTLKRLVQLRAFTLQAILHNERDDEVRLHRFDLLDTRKEAHGSLVLKDPGSWLVTPLMEASPAQPLETMDQSLAEAALLCGPEKTCLLAGPAGPGEAYTTVEVRHGRLTAAVLMDGVTVPPGGSRQSEEMLFCLEPPSEAISLWTRWVAITHRARMDKGPVSGWCSWYDRTTNIDETHILNVAEVLSKNPDVFGRGILQIDDGYQKMDGDWTGSAKFPSGMAGLASRIRSLGWVPGVWFAPLMIHPEHPWTRKHPDALQTNAQGIANLSNPNPFHPDGAKWINPDHPAAREFLHDIVADARKNGYGYIKIDFNGIGNRFTDPSKTRFQVFRELYARYREAAGDAMYILSCLGSPQRAVVGYADAARIGPDSHPAHFDKCLLSVLRFQIFQGIWWQNDPDVSYLAAALPSRTLGPTPQGEELWKSWHGINALVGGTAMVSEPLDADDCRKAWRQFSVMRPASIEPARLLHLGEEPCPGIFGFAASRPYGSFAVYLLYNRGEEEAPLTLDFAEAGLPPETPCAVFDFWSNTVIGIATGSYTTGPLPPHASRLLRFTPLDADKPLLVGSDLHLSIGATEIQDLRITRDGITVELNKAGAAEGHLTFHSRDTLAPGQGHCCRVPAVTSPGENLWRVHVTGRAWDQPQSFTLVRRKSPAET